MIDSVRAVELYARGFGTPVIARMLGASQIGIKAALLRNDVPRRNRRRRVIPPRDRPVF